MYTVGIISSPHSQFSTSYELVFKNVLRLYQFLKLDISKFDPKFPLVLWDWMFVNQVKSEQSSMFVQEYVHTVSLYMYILDLLEMT